MITTIENWLEWRRLCALGRCGESTRSALRSFARSKFALYVDKFGQAASQGTPAAVVRDAGDCWQLFESHINLGRRGDGKSLKHWIFSRVSASEDEPLKIVQGGVKLIIRDVVRSHLARERARAGSVSIEAPISGSSDGGSGGICLRDLLSSPRESWLDLERAEMIELAKGLSEEILSDLAFEARIALLARYLGLPLSNPAVAEVAGRKKSMLCRIWRRCVEDLAARVEQDYADEERQWRIAFAEQLLEELNNSIFLWARVEKRCADLLDIVEIN